MALDSRHPAYTHMFDDWTLMRDTYAGERAVKAAGQLYLPPSSGMVADGMEPNQPGRKAYDAYRMRAVFHDFVSDAVEAMLGMMHRKPPVIELPKPLDAMLARATPEGEGLGQLLRRINEAQLVTGRLGLLLDLPPNPDAGNPRPYIAVYDAERIINWDEGAEDPEALSRLNLVVLDETGDERQTDFTWQSVRKFRVLTLGDLNGSGTYRAAEIRDEVRNPTDEDFTEPILRGRTLTEIPFVFVDAKDLMADPDDPPLGGLARLALAIYRGEADYRQNLFMQGQDTLVRIGVIDQDEGEDTRTGAGAVINLPVGGDAKYIGVDSQGLTEQRLALENDRESAAERTGRMMDIGTREAESGEALRIRVSAQTATLTQLALAGAGGLEMILRMAARWVGADENAVHVQPNLDFADAELTGRMLAELMTAKTLGAPISLSSIHTLAQRRGMTELEFEEEMRLIESEGSGPAPDLDDE